MKKGDLTALQASDYPRNFYHGAFTDGDVPYSVVIAVIESDRGKIIMKF